MWIAVCSDTSGWSQILGRKEAGLRVGGRESKKNGPHRRGAGRTNHFDLFYLVVFPFDSSHRPDRVLGEVLVFFTPAFASFFFVNSARTVEPTLARSIL